MVSAVVRPILLDLLLIGGRLAFLQRHHMDYSHYLRDTVEAAQQTFECLKYEVSGRVATVTLSRPERFNAISSTMPYEIQRAMFLANTDGTRVRSLSQLHFCVLPLSVFVKRLRVVILPDFRNYWRGTLNCKIGWFARV